MYKDTPASIAYCAALRAAGRLGPAMKCTRVVVYMPDGPWVAAFTGPYGGGCCGFGESDFGCSIELDEAAVDDPGAATASRTAAIRKLAKALEQPPLRLSVATNRGRMVGVTSMRASPLLSPYFEHVAGEPPCRPWPS